MTDQTPAAPDYRDTVFLPKTDFPMKAGLPQKEPQILAGWEASDLYGRLRAARAGREQFILHDGPPYANGDIHIGHALNHILKDMVIRTQTLLGKDAPYVPGWDCHGLPIEWKVEEQYRKKKLNKDDVPVEEFRAECRAYAAHWVGVQKEQLKRLGQMGAWDRPYLTMDYASEAGIVAELLKFAESGQLYRGAKPVMWSPVEKTALAEAEVEYEDIVSTQVDVAFEIVDAPNCPELVGAFAVIWTTTPWTIPVNQAIAYGPDVEYVAVRLEKVDLIPTTARGTPPTLVDRSLDITVLVASALLDQFKHRACLPMAPTWRLGDEIWRGKGSDLAGATAHHPMANLFRHPGEGRGPGAAGAAVALDPGLRRDDDVGGTSPLPLAGGAGGGDVARDADGHNVASIEPTPNPSREREGSNVDPASPLAEFFLRPRPFLPGDFVTTESGTGLVHMAPDHGEDDFALCKAHGLEPVFAVEGDGKYRADWAWLAGQGSVINPKFNAPDGPICADLRAAGGLVAASADYKHSYPHSWRSKAKVIYRCTPQWFVPMDRGIAAFPSTTSFAGGPPPRAGEEQTSPPRNGEGDQPQAGGGESLRARALAEIERVRFVPEKGRNRIGAMVAGRPDWVLSRQRAWGVPITLFVDRRTGQYLNDPAVNARIIDAVAKGGVDAWSDANAAHFLGEGRDPADYERIADILDVWFDSGSTHAFVLESGRWPELRSPADLYLEGSDQHRGWFQSSLLESCATRGRAPYDAVLTHGFTMDQTGRKMSKSLGNTINPLDLMRDVGADIIRLWALSVDFTEDHRIGKEILAGVSDQYRKLRNSFRYMLGALDGFTDAERVAVDDMPELERYMLARLAALDASMRTAVADYDFNSYVRALTDFANEDLSAFFFDIRKDVLYCDVGPACPGGTATRRAYRTVLDTMFHALVRYAAPVLVFTAEEVWGTRFPDGDSVHLLEWPDVSLVKSNEADGGRWDDVMHIRRRINETIEPLRAEKIVKSSLEADVRFSLRNRDVRGNLATVDMAELAIVASVEWVDPEAQSEEVLVTRTTYAKCGRCWRHLPDVPEDGTLCGRCTTMVGQVA